MENRIILRELNGNDLNKLFALYNNQAVAQYMRHGKHEDITQTKVLLDTYLQEENYAYAMINKIDNDFIGYISLSLMDKEKESYSLTIMSFEKYWGGGYSSEATQLILVKAKELPVKEILAYISVENVGSCKVMEKSGFSHYFTIDENSNHPVLVYRYQINRE